MGFHCGIVGLPNVGKTTIFNAITAAGIDEANFPFSTVEPNRQIVAVADSRLDELTRIYTAKKVVPAGLEIVDIAGLVKGSGKGEGIGNQFLGHIKDVEALLHVVRCFEDNNISHAYDDINPARDVEDVDLELVFKDIETLENKIYRIGKKAKAAKDLRKELDACEKIRDLLGEGIPARKQNLTDFELAAVKECTLLSLKPVLYIANIKEGQDENDPFVTALAEIASTEKANMVVVAGRAEAEIAELDPEDQKEFSEALGLKESSLSRLIHEGYRALGLITMFTGGPTEAHAWTIRKGLTAPQAAGKIHSDMEQGFIRMEVIPIATLLEYGGEKGAKAAGKMRLEGKEYIVQDGDVVIIRFNK